MSSYMESYFAYHTAHFFLCRTYPKSFSSICIQFFRRPSTRVYPIQGVDWTYGRSVKENPKDTSIFYIINVENQTWCVCKKYFNISVSQIVVPYENIIMYPIHEKRIIIFILRPHQHFNILWPII